MHSLTRCFFGSLCTAAVTLWKHTSGIRLIPMNMKCFNVHVLSMLSYLVPFYLLINPRNINNLLSSSVLKSILIFLACCFGSPTLLLKSVFAGIYLQSTQMI